MIKIVSLIAFALLLSAMTVCKPALLGSNKFLEDFVTHEILALMAVIVTVTLASVANVHLALNRMVLKKFSDHASMITATKNVKKELSDNGWYIFWGFAVMAVLLVAKGASENIILHSAVNGTAVWILALHIACMHDIYGVVFGMTELEFKMGLPTTKEFPVDVPDLKDD